MGDKAFPRGNMTLRAAKLSSRRCTQAAQRIDAILSVHKRRESLSATAFEHVTGEHSGYWVAEAAVRLCQNSARLSGLAQVHRDLDTITAIDKNALGRRHSSSNVRRMEPHANSPSLLRCLRPKPALEGTVSSFISPCSKLTGKYLRLDRRKGFR